ncbi:hypothetical protein K461DRAFT_39063 [Myriangium duriaei CBS 260.36]|uniref:Uncharacterized protein n=1 Tax=Myriangium duriaei CBS 260.36 TaxID=1168546 RepID=A0A9P4IYK8_9PEZI|nr:hypothetical protein K461DRAFT_39063 [Myriangium duriaei CBS 260.36]
MAWLIIQPHFGPHCQKSTTDGCSGPGRRWAVKPPIQRLRLVAALLLFPAVADPAICYLEHLSILNFLRMITSGIVSPEVSGTPMTMIPRGSQYRHEGTHSSTMKDAPLSQPSATTLLRR